MAYHIRQNAIRLIMASTALNNSYITYIILKTLGWTFWSQFLKQGDQLLWNLAKFKLLDFLNLKTAIFKYKPGIVYSQSPWT